MTTQAESASVPGSINVAVVEDHPITRSGLSAYLHMAGCSVVGQENAVEALAELRPPPEVVVCDLHLPGRSGAAAIAYLAELGAIVLATSGVAKPEEVLDAIAAGAHGFLAKTAPPQTFARAVTALARGSFDVSPELAGYLLDDQRRRPLLSGELSATALSVLRGFAQGDTADEVATAFGLSADGLSGLLSRVWEAARRRRQRYAPSPREREVLALVVQGYTHKEVATRLGISTAWLADVLEHIRDKYVALHSEANQAIAPLAAAHRWAAELGIE